MKRKTLIVAVALLLLSSVSFQSCIGSFSLTNKVLTWNRNVSNKFVNELVFFAFWVLPVYEVTAAADLLVINSIEFWSGNTPLASNNQVIETEHGNYQILASQTGYDVVSPDGSRMSFEFDIESQTWSLAVNGNQKIDFLKFIDENHVMVPDAQGEFVDIELTRESVDSYKNSLLPMVQPVLTAQN
ncbi:MAG: DUF3332 domain-containing protein [Muribaculaceae bacterium]|nr:DUF3332 domain-containing protein [Muribaculaceae bacterium]